MARDCDYAPRLTPIQRKPVEAAEADDQLRRGGFERRARRDSVRCYNTSGGFLHTPIEQLTVNAAASIERGIGAIKLVQRSSAHNRGRQRGPRIDHRARQCRHRIAACQQGATQCPADKTGCTSDENPHRPTPFASHSPPA